MIQEQFFMPSFNPYSLKGFSVNYCKNHVTITSNNKSLEIYEKTESDVTHYKCENTQEFSSQLDHVLNFHKELN